MSLLNQRVYDTNEGKTGTSLDRIRKIFHSSMQHMNSEGSVFEFGSDENFYWFTSGFDEPFFNQVTIYERDPEVFERAIKKFYDLNTVHSVFLGGAGLHHAQTLQARGYVMRGATPLMAYALDPKVDQHSLRAGLEVRRVESKEDLEIAQLLLASGFGMSMDIVKAYSESLFGNSQSFRYILLDENVPVSTTHFVRTDKFLGCFDVTTPPEHQRKNYGDELMKWAFATHAGMGDELVVLQASLAGQPLYRKRGFQFLEFAQGWFMEDTTRMRRFTHLELELEGFKLRQLQESDSAWLIPFWNDEAVTKWMNVPKNFGEKEFTATLTRLNSVLANGTGINWVVERDGVPVAMLACHSTDWKSESTEIGFATIPAFRGQGIMPTVLRGLSKFLIEQYGFERIEVQADVANEASRKVAEKVGFTFEGALRRRFLNDGELTDDAVYSIIKSDLAG